MLNKILKIDSCHAYACERLVWHNLDLYDKQVSRQQIFIEDNQQWRNNCLRQMTFISGCDASQMDFKLLVDMLRSLRNLSVYKHVDINIFDCGMTDDQKHFLCAHFPIKNIVIPKLSVPIKSGYINLEMITRPFIPEYFPGYKYYIHLDADTWIQDENAIDAYLLMASKQKIAIARHVDSDKFLNNCGCTSSVIAPSIWNPDLFAKIPFCNAGIFCIEHPSHFFSQYKDYLLENLSQCGAQHISEQSALNCVISQNWPIEILSPHYNCLIPNRLQEKVLNKKGLLLLNVDRPIGIAHLAGRHQKQAMYPYLHSVYDIEKQKEEKISFYFSVWPWKDKPEIKDLLLKEANDVLSNL